MIYPHLFKILNVPTLLLNYENISLTLIRNTDTLLKRGYQEAYVLNSGSEVVTHGNTTNISFKWEWADTAS